MWIGMSFGKRCEGNGNDAGLQEVINNVGM